MHMFLPRIILALLFHIAVHSSSHLLLLYCHKKWPKVFSPPKTIHRT